MIPAPSEPRTRIGLIIPSANRLTEPQMRQYAPPDVEIHVTRLRMTGAQHKPLQQLLPAIVEATQALSDAQCDVIVFHCMASATEDGLDGNALVAGAMRDALADRVAVRIATTASAALAGLRALQVRKVLLLSPYVQTTNDHEVAFLREAGLGVVGSYCLGLAGSDQFVAVSPDDWLSWARLRLADHPDADGIFLSCTNTHTPEVIVPLEAAVHKPVMTSNQAVLWYALRLAERFDDNEALGRLFQLDLRSGSYDYARYASTA